MSNLIHSHSQWGPADQIGAGNLLTVEKRLSALGSIRSGRVYDVSHEIYMGAPFMAPNQTPFLMSIFGSWRDTIKRRRKMGATNDAGTNLERIEMTAHVGTHIDALGPFLQRRHALQRQSGADVVTDWGLDQLGIEHAPPMITRGLLFDVAGVSGGPHMLPGQTITPDDLKRAADAGGFSVEPGDIALIRTGWGRYFGIDNAKYLEGEPGLDVPGGEMAYRPGHRRNRRRQHGGRGAAEPDQGRADAGASIRAGRVRRLPDREPCAGGTGAPTRVYAACFILLATKIRGATGAPVRPVVIV